MKTIEEIEEIFDKYDDEYMKFDRIINKRSNRPDMHAFITLDELFNGNVDLVCATEHDEIYLDIHEHQICSLDETTIIDLIRCGVRYNDDCLCMYV